MQSWFASDRSVASLPAPTARIQSNYPTFPTNIGIKRDEYLLHFANRLSPFPEDQKIPENRVSGCASQVYVVATVEGGKVSFQADAQIVKGLVGLLVEGLDGLTPTEVMQLTPHFI